MPRHELDFYETPGWCVAGLFEKMRIPCDLEYVVDPSAGTGAILNVAKSRGWDTMGYDIDLHRAEIAAKQHDVKHQDFLTLDQRFDKRALCIMNPPFSHCFEFVKKACDCYRVTAALLRLGFLGSNKRHEWLRCNSPSQLIVLSSRPSFTADGKTDHSEYAWMVWDAFDVGETRFISKAEYGLTEESNE